MVFGTEGEVAGCSQKQIFDKGGGQNIPQHVVSNERVICVHPNADHTSLKHRWRKAVLVRLTVLPGPRLNRPRNMQTNDRQQQRRPQDIRRVPSQKVDSRSLDHPNSAHRHAQPGVERQGLSGSKGKNALLVCFRCDGI